MCVNTGWLAINAYEQVMKQKHSDFKIVKCSTFINKEYPWLHAAPDFLCFCDCCGEGCGEFKCPLCIENCDFDSYVCKSSSCLKKENAGKFWLMQHHEYYYQTQQQLFTVKRKHNDFIVRAFDCSGTVTFFHQRIMPDEQHWNFFCPSSPSFGELVFFLKC